MADNSIRVHCGCLSHQVTGLLCAKAVCLLHAANLSKEAEGFWDFTSPEFFAKFTLLSSWQAQCQIEKFKVPREPKDLESRAADLRKGGALPLYPPPIPKSAGRPPIRGKKAQKLNREPLKLRRGVPAYEVSICTQIFAPLIV